MLFGKEHVQQQILDAADKIAKRENFKLIFAASHRSVSNGTHNYTSDYDVRFLFVRNDFPEVLRNPENMREEEIYFKEPKENLLFDFEHDDFYFWDASAFFFFLRNPSMSGQYKPPYGGLYWLVIWLMKTPYAWDPYGLQNKISPLLDTFLNSKMLLNYYKDSIIWNYQYTDKKELLYQYYFRNLICAMSIEWLLEYKTCPPVHIRTLLAANSDKELVKEIEKQLSLYRDKARMTEEHRILYKHKRIFDEYIEKNLQRAINTIPLEKEVTLSWDYVSEIYKIIAQALQEETIRGINQSYIVEDI